MTDNEILKVVTDSNDKMGLKIDALTSMVSDYKSDTNAQLSTLKEKVTQVEEKVRQSYIFHNKNTEKFSALEKLIGDNAHMVQEISGAVKSNKTGLDRTREEIKDITVKVDADDVKSSTKKDIWKAVGGTLTLVFIALFGALAYFKK